MKNFLKLFYVGGEGQGNMTYSGSNIAGGGSGVTGADQGLSKVGANAELGQLVGTVGDPATMAADREIPTTHGLYFGKNNGVANTTLIHPNFGLAVSNNLGQFLNAQWALGPNTTQFQMTTDDGLEIILMFAGTNAIVYNASPSNFARFDVARAWVSNGVGGSIRTTSTVNDTFAQTDTTIIVNDAVGNVNININPATLINQYGWIKKRGATANTVTLTATSGLIFGNGTSATTFVFTTPGQSVQFQSDGTNLYIL